MEEAHKGAKFRASVIRTSGLSSRSAAGLFQRYAGDTLVTKSDTPTQLEETGGANEWLTPPVDRRGLAILVDSSTILPQCIRAYAANIVGYGIGVRYIDDLDIPTE